MLKNKKQPFVPGNFARGRRNNRFNNSNGMQSRMDWTADAADGVEVGKRINNGEGKSLANKPDRFFKKGDKVVPAGFQKQRYSVETDRRTAKIACEKTPKMSVDVLF